MATKKVVLAGIGPVTFVRSTRNRSLRLTVASGGIRVSMPLWTPYSAATAFALAHSQWIKQELEKQPKTILESGQRVGKMHYLRFEQILNDREPNSRVTGTEVIVRIVQGEHSDDPAVQKRAEQAVIRALKKEGEMLLPPRLASLAEKHGLSYNSVSVKSLKRRWGSCSSKQDITFNLYLMELPWEYIDYVSLHELTHTIHMHHGPEFWKMLTTLDPQAKVHSKLLRRHQPTVGNWQPGGAED